MSDKLVLVTGASGFIATHVIKLLQEQGYRVRGTVRNLKDEKKVKHLYNLCPNAQHKLELVEADLLNEDSWKEALKGCDFVQHISSPISIDNPANEDDMIKPAVEGTLNVLCAAAAAGTVQRVVLTSSVVAITSKGGNDVPYTEADWTEDGPDLSPYYKSKVRAEKAAWDFVKQLPGGQPFELAVVNPAFVFGPIWHGTTGASIQTIKQILNHEVPAVPHLSIASVDVRDVALAHWKCMIMEEAAGHRHLVFNKSIYMTEMAEILAEEFNPQGYNVPTRRMPDFILLIACWFKSGVKNARDFGKREVKFDNARMREVLGIQPIDMGKCITEMAYTMIDAGFIDKTPQYKGRQITNNA